MNIRNFQHLQILPEKTHDTVNDRLLRGKATADLLHLIEQKHDSGELLPAFFTDGFNAILKEKVHTSFEFARAILQFSSQHLAKRRRGLKLELKISPRFKSHFVKLNFRLGQEIRQPVPIRCPADGGQTFLFHGIAKCPGQDNQQIRNVNFLRRIQVLEGIPIKHHVSLRFEVLFKAKQFGRLAGPAKAGQHLNAFALTELDVLPHEGNRVFTARSSVDWLVKRITRIERPVVQALIQFF